MLVTVESRYYDITLLMIVSLCMQVYDRLQRVNVTMSHKSSVRLVTKIGEGFDSRVAEWKDNAINQLKILHQV